MKKNVEDQNGNRNYYGENEFFQTQKEAQKALDSLIGCRNCVNCSDCRSCRYCRYCHYCSDCSYCSDCRSCENYKSNPQRFVSEKICSRSSQTVIYWIDKDVQIVCGYFRGNLYEFRESVNKTYKDNKYLKEYQEFIKICEYLISQ